MTGALVVQADALRLPLPDESVDLVVTSPPYAFLRSYNTGYPELEVGNEGTPQQYLEALWAATAEMVRVLKPSGSMFVDLGDKYAGGGMGGHGGGRLNGYIGEGIAREYSRPKATGVRDKSLLLLPERYRIGCVDQTNPYYREQYTRELLHDLMDGEITPDQARAKLAAYDAEPKSKGLGLIARSVTIWNKPNGLPESVTDRVRRSHEDWVHLVKQPRYYSAIDEVREPGPGAHSHGSQPRNAPERGERPEDLARLWQHSLGKLPGSVWQIPSEPLRLPEWLGVDHYASFPSEWPRRLILGWSPPGICLDCGQGRVPVVDRKPMVWRESPTIAGRTQPNGSLRPASGTMIAPAEATILGYACSCTPYTDHPGSGESSGPSHEQIIASGRASIGTFAGPDATKWQKARGGAYDNRPKVGPWREYHLDRWTPPPTRPAIILDPFGGTGTTAMVARALGRIGLSFDLSHAYSRAARWRIWSDDAAKAISRTNLERQGQLL